MRKDCIIITVCGNSCTDCDVYLANPTTRDCIEKESDAFYNRLIKIISDKMYVDKDLYNGENVRVQCMSIANNITCNTVVNTGFVKRHTINDIHKIAIANRNFINNVVVPFNNRVYDARIKAKYSNRSLIGFIKGK